MICEHAFTILIAEDDADMARLNARLLQRRGYRTHVADSVAEARKLAGNLAPDLFILDIGLGDGDGISLCQELRQTSDAPIIFLTGKSDISYKVRGLSVGGDYYLTKPFVAEELVAVVESLLRRAYRLAEEGVLLQRGSLVLKPAEGKALVGGRDAGLTGKEFALLLLLVQHEGEELPYEQIYRRVWGTDMMGNSSALRQLVSRLKKKLDEENSQNFAIYNTHGKGYVFMVD